MKKPTLIATAALLFIFTFSNKVDMYEKKVIYNEPIKALENFIKYSNILEEAKVNKSRYKLVRTNEFYESISRRYRLYLGDNKQENRMMGFYSIPTFIESYKIEELKENQVESIKLNHEESYSIIENYKRPIDIKYFKVTGKCLRDYNWSRNNLNDKGVLKKEAFENIEKNTGIFNGNYVFIVVDEGEGYVVDYYEEIGSYDVSREE